MKIAILGGGPGGYVCAIRAAQLGAEVTIIDETIGGTCLNTGCIPTKVLLHSTEIYRILKNESISLGLEMDNLKLKWDTIQERKSMVVSQLVDGVKTLLESNKVNILKGKGKFISKNEIEVISSDGVRTIVNFNKAVIATGSSSMKVPIPGIESEGVLTSTEALDLTEIPKSICIIGGGVIGTEFANIYSNIGSKVTIVEMLPNIVANMDEDIVDCLKSSLMEAGIDIYTSAKVEKIKEEENKLIVTMSTESESKDIVVDKVLVSTGRKPNIVGFGLETLGIKTQKGSILVDRFMKTNVDNIYAIGDCVGGVLLAHVASSEGIVAAENIMGKSSQVDFRTTPYCVYTRPELASVGLTEKQALSQGYNIKVSRFPLYANGKSVIMGDVNGLVKFVVDSRTDEILGLHMAGNSATELIAVGALAIRLEATLDEIITTIHAHPTVNESIYESALEAYGNAIHLPL